MKRFLIIVLVLLLVIFFTGCSLWMNDENSGDSLSTGEGSTTQGSPGRRVYSTRVFEKEANNTMTSANGPYGVHTIICGDTDSNSNYDWFKFNSTSGLNFFLDGYTYYISGVVYNAGGSVLGYLNYHQDLKINYTGTVYVRISGYSNINYDLVVSSAGQSYIPDMYTIYESESNNSGSSADGTYFVNLDIRGKINNSSDVDYFKFDCVSHAVFYLDGYTYYISGTVYDAAFNTLGYISYNSPFTLNYDGVIYVKIGGYSGISYNLNVSRPLNTEHVVVVVMDGVRFLEAFNIFMPKIFANIVPNGASASNFQNTGVTRTIPGHTALMTGINQSINNDGSEYPAKPGIAHYLRKQYNLFDTDTMVIASKYKLRVLARTETNGWLDYTPYYSCGLSNGMNRSDADTYTVATHSLVTNQPRFMLINFMETDTNAHAGDFQGYLSSIATIDGYTDSLWSTICSTEGLAGETTLFFVNDHGRHLTDWTDHGDDCEGCRKIKCIAIGPDMKVNYSNHTAYDLRDVTTTAAYLLGVHMPTSDGKVMRTILN